MSGQKLFWGAAAVIVVAIVAFMIWGPKPKQITIGALLSDPSSLPGLMDTSGTWAANTDTLAQRLDSMAFPRLSMEGSVLHIHQHLDLYIHGVHTTVPSQIGIANFFSPIHVHDQSGIIHVESPVQATFYLGQFFDVWGLRFTKDCIGGYCTDTTNSLRVYVNGKSYEGDPRTIELAPHEEIAIVYGTSAEVPQNIPSSYAFPSGD